MARYRTVARPTFSLDRHHNGLTEHTGVESCSFSYIDRQHW